MLRMLAPLLVSGVALGSAGLLRRNIVDDVAHRRATFEIKKEALVSPGHAAMQLISLEHAHGLADLMWLQMVQVIAAESVVEPGVADRLERWTMLAADTDPQYFVVHYAAGINLMVYAKRPDAADRVFQRGRKELPQRWEFPFLLGYNEYFVHGRPKRAGKWWLEAANKPKVPFYVASLIGRAHYQAGDESGARKILEDLIKILPDGPHKEDAVTRLLIFDSEEILKLYDAACAKHLEENGVKPSAQQLFTMGVVAKPPKDLFDKEITLDEKCRARTEMIQVREDEAAERIGSQKDL